MIVVVGANMRLKRLREALRELSDNELEWLHNSADVAVSRGRKPAPIFAWLAHVAAWEIAQREGQNYVLRLPHDALEDNEMPDCARALHSFWTSYPDRSDALNDVFAAAAELIRSPVH